MPGYVKFDWVKAKEMHSPRKFAFLIDNQFFPITETEFVTEMQKIRSERKGRGGNYSPHHLKYEYRRLRERFGFFPNTA